MLSKNGERARSSQIWNERDAFARFGELRLVTSHRGIPITQALKYVEKTNKSVRQNAIEAGFT